MRQSTRAAPRSTPWKSRRCSLPVPPCRRWPCSASRAPGAARSWRPPWCSGPGHGRARGTSTRSAPRGWRRTSARACSTLCPSSPARTPGRWPARAPGPAAARQPGRPLVVQSVTVSAGDAARFPVPTVPCPFARWGQREVGTDFQEQLPGAPGRTGSGGAVPGLPELGMPARRDPPGDLRGIPPHARPPPGRGKTRLVTVSRLPLLGSRALRRPPPFLKAKECRETLTNAAEVVSGECT